MRRVRVAITATAVAVIAPLLATSHHPAAGSPVSGAAVRAVVTLAPGTSIPYQADGTTVVQSLPHVGAELVTGSTAAIERLRHDPHVLGVSPNWHGHLTGRGQESGGTSDGLLAPQIIGGAAGKDGTGRGATVALLDTGVNDTPALDRASGRLIDGVDVSALSAGGAAVTDGSFTDGYGHGTFIASLIAGGRVPGSGHTAIGVAPAAHVVVVKVADGSGVTSLLQVLAGMDWVAAHAGSIQVANLSLSVDRPTAPAYGADPLTAAVEHVRAAGVLVVAAVGNTPGQVGDPGTDAQALTVGAADLSNGRPQVAAFSGSGDVAGVSKPDVVAPGVHVLGVESRNTVIGQANPQAWDGDGLFRGSGTSEATALTSGVAAAVFADHPNATPVAVKTAIRVRAGQVTGTGAGTGMVSMTGGGDHRGRRSLSDPSGESALDAQSWQANSWLGGQWADWLASSWSASSWSASSWSASSWSASSWSASSWSASSWSASSWSASSWSDASWGDDR